MKTQTTNLIFSSILVKVFYISGFLIEPFHERIFKSAGVPATLLFFFSRLRSKERARMERHRFDREREGGCLVLLWVILRTSLLSSPHPSSVSSYALPSLTLFSYTPHTHTPLSSPLLPCVCSLCPRSLPARCIGLHIQAPG